MERYFLSACCCVMLAFICRADGSAAGTLNRFGLSEGSCSLFQEGEICLSAVETWYFESEETDGGCVNATEERCGGKGNSFQTREECEDKCLGKSERNYEARFGYGGSYRYPYSERQLSQNHNQDHCWVNCPNRCPGGYDRCHSCECNENPSKNPICPPVRCPSHCETDRVIDDNGCHRCDCRRRCPGNDCDQCSRVRCPTVCPRPYYPQLQQCCGCRSWGGYSRPGCGHFQCSNHCEYGHIEHPNYGCRSCECRRPPHYYPYNGDQEPVRQPSSYSGFRCPENLCELPCHNGYKKSSDGCDLCECAEYTNPHHHLHDCSHLICRRDCAFGCYVNQVTCDTRVCLPSSAVLHRGQPYRQDGQYCPNIRSTCRQYCPYGYARDSRGCEKCQCLDDADPYEP